MRSLLWSLAVSVLLAGCGTVSTASFSSPAPSTAATSPSPGSPAPSTAAASPSPGPAASPLSVPPAGLFPRATNLAYDSTRREILLFGGTGAGKDTWTWDGMRWTQRTSAASPAAREGAALTDDPDHKLVLLFGGADSSTLRNDTWLWDGSGWKEARPAHSPSGREGGAITWDAAHHVALLFGGYARYGGFLNDTWTWDGTDWTQRAPATSPPARGYGRVAFDSAHGSVVLFGGFDGMDDTWTWDGSTWSLQHPANSPPGLREATPVPQQMAYDSVRKVIVMLDPTAHGALSASDTMDTWTWDGTTWSRLTPAASPPARDGFGFVFDAALGISVMAGGYALGDAGDTVSTWGWDGANWSKVG